MSEESGVLDVYRSLGQLYTIQRRFAEAEEVYRLAIPLTPQDPYAYILLAQTQLDRGLTAAAETTLLDALDFVDSSADIYCTLGDINRTQADYREAVGYFGNCARLDPASAAAHEERHLIRILEIDPEHPRALGYLLLSDLYERLGDPIRSAEYGRRGRALPGR